MNNGPADALLALQASVTKTASFDSAGLDLGNGFAPPAPGQPMVGEVDVSARDHTTGDETYTFTLQQSADNATFADCGAAVSITGTGVFYACGFVTMRYTRLHMVAGGTTPSITYQGNLFPGKY